MALDEFARVWDDKYPQISKSWRAHWENLNTLFSYPPDIRKAIYTTNAIESLNSVIRAAIKKRKVFPTDDSVRKVIYLAIKDASKKWSMPIQNWRLAMSRFIIEFGDRPLIRRQLHRIIYRVLNVSLCSLKHNHLAT